MKFAGYRRRDGSVGIRNYVAVIPIGACVNEIPVRVANEVQGTVALPHNQACSHLGKDVSVRKEVIVGLGKNPNVGAVVLVGIGCEVVDIESIAQKIAQSGKEVEAVTINREGTFSKALGRSEDIARSLVKHISELERKPAPLNTLVLGLKCAGSDTFSGMLLNSIVGNVADVVIKEGGAAVFSETTELIGAEHILAKRAKNEEIANSIYLIVNRMEGRIKAMGVDVRGTEPTPGNIKAGLTTIEEKALGAIAKAGGSTLRGVLEYGEIPLQKGLFIMDGPARTAEVLTGFAAAGIQATIIAMGSGLPVRLPNFPACPGNIPILPTIKISTVSRDYCEDNVDVYIETETEIEREKIVERGTRQLLGKLLEVLSERTKTRTESRDYIEPLCIYTTGPVI
jgi:altronate dehydratase large subunit